MYIGMTNKTKASPLTVLFEVTLYNYLLLAITGVARNFDWEGPK